jgi:hypothetical protein
MGQGDDWGGWICTEAEWGVAPRLPFNEQEGKESSELPEYVKGMRILTA